MRGPRPTAMPCAAWGVADAQRCRCLPLVWRRGAAKAGAAESAPDTTEGRESHPRRGSGTWRPPETSNRTAMAVLMPHVIQNREADRMIRAFSVADDTAAGTALPLPIFSTLQATGRLVNNGVPRSGEMRARCAV